MPRHHAVLLVLACAAAVTSQELPQQDAARMQAKLELILETGDSPRGEDAPPVRTSFTEHEVNAYFEVYGPSFLPEGIANPRVVIDDNGRVAARGTVDLDAVRRSRERDWSDPLGYVTGTLDVTATGVVTGSNGTGSFRYESATIAGLSVSKRLLQEVVRFYSTTPELPNGFELDAPFELPAGIRSVTTERGRVTIVQ